MKFIIVNSFHRDDKGDAALLHVLIDQLKSIDETADIAIASMENPRDFPAFYRGRNIGSFELHSSSHIYRAPWHLFMKAYLFIVMVIVGTCRGRGGWLFPREVRKIFRECQTADLVVSVGGGYFITKKDLGSRLHLLFALQTLILCKKLGKKVMTAPVSVGPFQMSYEAKYTAWLLKKIDHVFLREDISKKYFLNSVNQLPLNIHRAPDSAFAFFPDGEYDIRSIVGAIDGDLVLAISVRNWMEKEKQDIYEQAHADLIDHIAEKYPNIKPVFIPQCTFPHADDDDRTVAERIVIRSKSKKVYVIKEEIDYIKVKLAYAKADFIIGTRFHSMVFGLAYFVPGIAIEYEHKTRGIMQDLGLEEWVININDVDTDRLVNLFESLLKGRKAYRQQLTTRMPAYIESSKRNIKVAVENSIGI